MIDMLALYLDNSYQDALHKFNNSNCKWNSFKGVHLSVSKNRCPICEYLFEENSETRRENKNGKNLLVPTVDHYRPQEYYPFLKCDHKNYLLMCFECNSSYKKSKFPIYNSFIRATNHQEVIEEKPLIINPIKDDVYELFVLVFKTNSRILELKPKASSGYLYEKAFETIKLFGLGYCEIYRHQSESIHNCRIRVLRKHFVVFYKFAKALIERDRTKANLEFKQNRELFKSYGIYEFIKRKQFEILA